MRVLLVDDFPAGNPDSHVVARSIAALEARGHEVDHLSLDSVEFAGFMTATERRAYETDEPLQADATRDSARRVQECDALLFCYPTVLFGVPPRLKSWLERVMVLGVAFVFDNKRRVRPGMTNVRRIAVVTTTPHTRRSTWQARDIGRRIVMRTIRLNCHPLCRRTFVRLHADANSGQVAERLSRALRW